MTSDTYSTTTLGQERRIRHAYELALTNIPGVTVQIHDTLHSPPTMILQSSDQDISSSKSQRTEVDLGDGLVMHLYDKRTHIFESISLIMWSCTADGIIQFVNPEWHTATGIMIDAEQQVHWTECVHPSDVPQVQKQWLEAIESQTSFEAEHRINMPDGSRPWYLTRCHPVLGMRLLTFKVNHFS